MGGNAAVNVNPLYLLRYHEEMNEMTVDAQLDFGHGNGNGEIWALGSCPKDANLVVACRGNDGNNNGNGNGNGNDTETALWRIPDSAMREDELDFYPDQDDYDDEYATNTNTTSMNMNMNMNSTGAAGPGPGPGPGGTNNNTSQRIGDINKSLEKICNLDLSARVTDMQWNPGSIPNCNDFDDANLDIDTHIDTHTAGSGSGSGSIGNTNSITSADLLTIQRENTNMNSTNLAQITLTIWDISTSSALQLNQIQIPIPVPVGATARARHMPMPNPPKASWDPHNHNLCAVTLGTNVGFVDMRVGKVVNGLKGCHRYGVTDVDYNPNKPHVLSSSGQDSLVKFWDLRYAAIYDGNDGNDEHEDHEDQYGSGNACSSNWSRHTPLRTLRGGHTHWTTCVKYNSFHDQLLLSGGTDSMVNLWRISSISSAPLMDLGGAIDDDDDDDDDDVEGEDVDEGGRGAGGSSNGVEMNLDGMSSSMMDPAAAASSMGMEGRESGVDSASVDTDGGNAPDVRVTKMEMREAIYDVAWSAADPWLFVTLGYDGNVVLNHVPSKEKYKILL